MVGLGRRRTAESTTTAKYRLDHSGGGPAGLLSRGLRSQRRSGDRELSDVRANAEAPYRNGAPIPKVLFSAPRQWPAMECHVVYVFYDGEHVATLRKNLPDRNGEQWQVHWAPSSVYPKPPMSAPSRIGRPARIASASSAGASSCLMKCSRSTLAATGGRRRAWRDSSASAPGSGRADSLARPSIRIGSAFNAEGSGITVGLGLRVGRQYGGLISADSVDESGSSFAVESTSEGTTALGEADGAA